MSSARASRASSSAAQSGAKARRRHRERGMFSHPFNSRTQCRRRSDNVKGRRPTILEQGLAVGGRCVAWIVRTPSFGTAQGPHRRATVALEVRVTKQDVALGWRVHYRLVRMPATFPKKPASPTKAVVVEHVEKDLTVKSYIPEIIKGLGVSM